MILQDIMALCTWQKESVRVVNDSAVMISPAMHRKYVIPRIRRIFETFGGGWCHSCGDYSKHLDDLIAYPEITALNFGNPEQWPDFEGCSFGK